MLNLCPIAVVRSVTAAVAREIDSEAPLNKAAAITTQSKVTHAHVNDLIRSLVRVIFNLSSTSEPLPQFTCKPTFACTATSDAVGQFLPRAPAANDVRGCNALLDHLVGATEQRQREGETERLGGLKIDNELDFCKQLDGQV